jgi:hypothetical protein
MLNFVAGPDSGIACDCMIYMTAWLETIDDAAGLFFLHTAIANTYSDQTFPALL